LLAPIDAASTTPPAGLTRSLPAGRPPVVAPAASSTTRPDSTSWRTRAATAVRERIRAPTDLGPGLRQPAVDEGEHVSALVPDRSRHIAAPLPSCEVRNNSCLGT
jgi:hypothetical protein